MPCCKSPSDPVPDAGRRRGLQLVVAAGWVSLGGMAVLAPVARADSEASTVTLARRADGLYLSARMPLELTPAMEDVLAKGVPLHFQWSAELVQSRWYWVDRSLGTQSRSVRLSYHALTRRWRLSLGSGGMSYSLHQNFDSLREALLVASRVSEWKVAEPAQLAGGSGLRVDFRFAIDLSQLPRPFQLGLTTQSGWNMTQQKSLAVPERLTPEGDAEPAEPRSEGVR
jgi:Domain of unknown function (DUF4390)